MNIVSSSNNLTQEARRPRRPPPRRGWQRARLLRGRLQQPLQGKWKCFCSSLVTTALPENEWLFPPQVNGFHNEVLLPCPRFLAFGDFLWQSAEVDLLLRGWSHVYGV